MTPKNTPSGKKESFFGRNDVSFAISLMGYAKGQEGYGKVQQGYAKGHNGYGISLKGYAKGYIVDGISLKGYGKGRIGYDFTLKCVGAGYPDVPQNRCAPALRWMIQMCF